MKITIIIGIKNYFTSPDAIKILLNYIENKSGGNLQLDLRLPKEDNFHMKCYVFLGQNINKAIVGSANLTGAGLDSRGELMVEVDNDKTIDIIVDYIDYYLNESENWCDYLNKYTNIYNKYKPQISKVNISGLFIRTKRHEIKHKMTIRYAAPTVGVLGKVSKEQEERVYEAFANIKKQFPDINKSNWIIYDERTEDEINTLKEKYPIGSCFDRPKDINHTWEIGSNRMICNVGAIVNTLDDEIVMFMNKGCIHYIVTEEISKAAERFGIKSDDEDYIPTKEQIDNYRNFILDKRNR